MAERFHRRALNRVVVGDGRLTGDGKDNALAAVANALDAAEDAAPREQSDIEPPAHDGHDDEGSPPGDKKWDHLPEIFPVSPLGKNGDYYFYLDANRQYRSFKHHEHGRLQIASLMGAAIGTARRCYPVYNKDGDLQKKRWDQAELAQDLMQEASRRGIWRALDRVRGPGAWRDDDGNLVLHCGDTLITVDGLADLGMIGRNVYPADEPQPRPAPRDQGNQAAIERLEMLLRTWNWRRPGIDPILLLGWIAGAMIGGALDWRPTVWITGGHGTGKSTAHELLNQLFDGGIVQSSNATAAGIWTALGYKSVPVSIDELEPEADDRKQQAVIAFARLASSGGLLLRGSADHKGAEFKARCCFLFSSILVPALQPADLSRMAILELDPLTETAKPPVLRPAEWRHVGAVVRRRLLDGWPRYADTLNTYRIALARMGHNARGCDQFGTLLACADLLLRDSEPIRDEVDQWTDELNPALMAETVENIAEFEKCLNHIRTAVPDVYSHGRRDSVAQILLTYWTSPSGFGNPLSDANEKLGHIGLRIVHDDEAAVDCLLVANAHPALEDVYRDTNWRRGVWNKSLKRARGMWNDQVLEARPSSKVVRIAGAPSRGVMVPIPIVIGQTLSDDVSPPPVDLTGFE